MTKDVIKKAGEKTFKVLYPKAKNPILENTNMVGKKVVFDPKSKHPLETICIEYTERKWFEEDYYQLTLECLDEYYINQSINYVVELYKGEYKDYLQKHKEENNANNNNK